MTFAAQDARAVIDRGWDSALGTLRDYIRIPNVSPAYDAGWRQAGHMHAAAALLRDWCSSRHLAGASVELYDEPDLTPLLLVDVPASDADATGTVVIYGHLDKQPEMTGWRQGLSAWEPVIEDDRLYGRGSADDGYAVFAAVTALEGVRAAGARHARCVILIEASEESGSPDLSAHMARLADRIGEPSLVIALDSGCASYDRLWVTTSLRGLVIARVTATVLAEGVHSGGSGPLPNAFRVLRHLLDRLEDSGDGTIKLDELTCEIPAERRAQAEAVAAELGDASFSYPLVEGVLPVDEDPTERILHKTWRPALTVTGVDGIPASASGGNVIHPSTTLKLSLRLPPTVDAARAADVVTAALTAEAPHRTHVEVDLEGAENGWNAPSPPAWLQDALDVAATDAYGAPPRFFGEGGSIPFIGDLQARFPSAAFVVTGVLGPGSNAHGPNEFLHLPTARRLTLVTSRLLAAHAERQERQG